MRIIDADIYGYYDGPTAFVGADDDTSYGQLVPTSEARTK